MQQELWGRQPAPPAFPLPGWCLDSCFPAPTGGCSFASQARLGCHSLAGVAAMKISCPSLMLLCSASPAMALSFSNLLVAAAFPQPCVHSHPVHPICDVELVTTSAPEALVWDVGCRDKSNRGPTSKSCVFPDHWLDIFPKACWCRWVFREDLNKEREEAWQLHLGLHQPLTNYVQTLWAAVALSLLSCWWLWFLLCLFIFTPLLSLLLLNSLFLLAPDKLLSLTSLKLLPLNNI